MLPPSDTAARGPSITLPSMHTPTRVSWLTAEWHMPLSRNTLLQSIVNQERMLRSLESDVCVLLQRWTARSPPLHGTPMARQARPLPMRQPMACPRHAQALASLTQHDGPPRRFMPTTAAPWTRTTSRVPLSPGKTAAAARWHGRARRRGHRRRRRGSRCCLAPRRQTPTPRGSRSST